METLRFDELRHANVARCEQVFHKLDDWDSSDWGIALGGEVGEALEVLGRFLQFQNTLKKLKRLEGADSSKDTQAERDRLVDQAVEEIADGVIYADLTVAHLRRDLGAAIIKKFNEVSEKRGSTIRL